MLRRAILAAFTSLLLAFLASISSAQVAVWGNRTYSGPVCTKPNCAMCNSIRQQIASQTAPVQASTQAYETIAVQRQVKRCQNGRCWYETVTEYVRRPVAVVKQSLTTQKPDMLTNAELVPTPQPVVEAMLAKLCLSTEDKLFDLGCGDGRFLVTAARDHGCSSIGIDLNAESVALARKNAKMEFVTPFVTVFQGDARAFDIEPATAVTMYLYPELMAELIPKLRPGTRIASYLHEIPGVDSERFEVGGEVFYVGVKQ